MAGHALPLLTEHWQEVAKHKDLLVLRPAWDTYHRIENAGNLLALAAWHDGQMVGYSASFVSPHLHYADVRVCQNDVLFVTPAHRGIGKQLMRETERHAKERGCQLVLWHAKQGSVLDRMLGREGSDYSVQDVIYARRL